MTNTIKKTKETKLAKFQNNALNVKEQKSVKGGSSEFVIIEEIIEG